MFREPRLLRNSESSNSNREPWSPADPDLEFGRGAGESNPRRKNVSGQENSYLFLSMRPVFAGKVRGKKRVPQGKSERLGTQEGLVEAAGVEPASENVTGQETTCLFQFMLPGLHRKRSRPPLRTDKKRVPLA